MKSRWNTLRRSVLALLCSAAMVCGGLMPMAVQADGPDMPEKPVFDPDEVTWITIADESFYETDEVWMEIGKDEDGDPIEDYVLVYKYYDEDQDVFIMPTDAGGTATFDYKTNTLTLTNASIGSWDQNSIYIYGDLTLVLEGDNNIYNSGFQYYGIYAAGDLTIQGNGSLTMERTDLGYGGTIYVDGSLTVQDGATVKTTGVPASADLDAQRPDNGISVNENMTIDNATVEIEDYRGTGLEVGQFGGNLTIQDGVLRMATSDPDGDMTADGLILYGEEKAAVYMNGDSELTISGRTRMGFYYNGELKNELAGVQVTPNNGNGKVTVTIGKDYSDTDAETTEHDGSYTVPYGDIAGHLYLRVTSVSAEPSPKGNIADKAAARKAGSHCDHTYAWETYKAATATTDGIMRYRCTKCGTVEYEVPTAAYYVFNKNAQEAIKNAAANATVTVSTEIFISFHEMVAEALAERPDVTLVVDYKNAGKNYEMTIPAGSGETLQTLFGDSQFAGFLYLGGAFATIQK